MKRCRVRSIERIAMVLAAIIIHVRRGITWHVATEPTTLTGVNPMMHLLLMRHAKSSWDDPSLADHDRPLNRRGRKTAPKMAEALEGRELLPDRIVTSGALRALETARIIGEVAGIEPEVREDLYLAGPDVWRKVLHEQPRSKCLLLVGHNPGMEDFLEQLTGSFHRLPTAAVAVLSVPDGTGPISLDGLTLTTVLRPKELDPD